MVSNVNPTDPKFIDENDLDTEGHRIFAFAAPSEEEDTEGHRIVTDVSPTEQDTAGLRPLSQSSEDEDPEGFYGRL